jgi:hypothetical protein
MTSNMRLADGRIIPEIAVLWRGRREVERMTAEGMPVILDRLEPGDLWEIGRSAYLADPPMTDERRAELVEMAAQIEQQKLAELERHKQGRIRLATPEELEHARVAYEATLPPKRQQELALVRRHNSAIANGDDRYAGLLLDQRLAQGEEILHLDPLGEGGDGGQDTSTVEHDGSSRTAPELHPETAEEDPPDESGGVDHGQGRSRARAQRRNRVRSVSYVDPARSNPMRDDDDD